MANYKKFEDQDQVYVEQNIFDNNELESYEAKFNFNGKERTTVLYFYEDRDKERFYLLGLLENLDPSTISIVSNDLSDIFKFKTAKTRLKYIYALIRNNEAS